MEEVILENQPALLDSSSLQGCLPWDFSKQVSEGVPVCFPEVQGCDPAICFASPSQNPDVFHLMITVAKAATKPPIPN